jgi:hypothetical protein
MYRSGPKMVAITALLKRPKALLKGEERAHELKVNAKT